MAGRRKPDPFVRCFEVGEPRLHEKGHTIYKVTLKTIRVDAPEDDVLETVLWKRYNDFKKLYKSMSTLHKALHRTEEFPPFAQAKLFGRFDDQVIIERQQSAQDLLNFVGQRHFLVNSKAFKQFLEGGEVVAVNPHSDPVLEPVRLSQDDTTSVGSDSDLSSVTSTTEHAGQEGPRTAGDATDTNREDVSVQDLGGVWQYRQVADNISLDDDDDETDFTDDSALGTPLPDNDLAFFDPMRDNSGGGGGGSSEDGADRTFNNLWTALSDLSADSSATTARAATLEASDMEKGAPLAGEGIDLTRTEGVGADAGSEPVPGMPTLPSVDSLASLELPSPPSDPLDDSEPEKVPGKDVSFEEFDPYRPQPGSPSPTSPTSGLARVVCGRGDLNFNLMDSGGGGGGGASEPTPDIVDSKPDGLTDQPQPPSSLEPPGPPGATDTAGNDHAGGPPPPPPSSSSASPARSPRRQLVEMDIGEKGRYIVTAARQISLAQQCEANGNYHMAFTYYKNSVGILLTGVQGDDNRGRREVVRRKTARYLMRAEEIYKQHLVARGTHDDNRWDTGQSSAQQLTQELSPQVALLQGAPTELVRFRVLGIIDKTLLVLDQTTNATHVMKVLHKDSRRRAVRSLVPCACPYMVRLHRFYETDTAIFLLLQHAIGGKLWHYVSGFLNQQQEVLIEDVFPGDLGPAGAKPTTNIYTGQYLHKSPTVKQLHSPPSPGTGSPGSPVSPSSGPASPSPRSRPPTLPELGERGEGEGASLDDPDLTAPAEATKSYTQLFSGGVSGITADDDGVREKGRAETRRPQLSESDSDLLDESGSRRDSDFLDDSQGGGVSHRDLGAKSKTLSTSSDGDVFCTAHESKIGSIERFQELLRESSKPSLENFSINSFDSDSAPCSRFDSTASDYIESIPEVSEASPQHQAPHKLVVGQSPTIEEVFLISGHNHRARLSFHDRLDSLVTSRPQDGSPAGQSPAPGARSSSEEGSAGLDGATDRSSTMVSSTPAKQINVMDSPPEEAVVLTRRDSMLGLEVAEKGPDSLSFSGSFGEPSIYDLHAPASSSSATTEEAAVVGGTADTGTGGGTVDRHGGSGITTKASPKVGKKAASTSGAGQRPDPRSPTDDGTDLVENGLTEHTNPPPTEPTSIPPRPADINGTASPLSSPPSSPSRGAGKATAGPEKRRPVQRASGERSLETDTRRTRKRTLSGVFGELDLAEDEERAAVHLPEGCIRQWAAEIVTALAALHKQGIICRDMRPDNILLGERGHILLTYFSQWNCVLHDVEPSAITQLYSAPEVCSVFEVTAACDWWSLGVLLFELLTGKSLASSYPGGFTSHTSLVIPEHVSPEAQSLLSELLRFNPSERLGAGLGGADDVRHHPFFSSVNWADLQG